MYSFEEVPVGRSTVSISIFGPSDATSLGLRSLSLGPLQRQPDVHVNQLLAHTLSKELTELEVRDAFAPHVAPASGRIVPKTDLKHTIRLGNANLHRNNEINADGVFIEQNEAFVMSSAGCPIIVASGDEYNIVAHAARDSLLDRDTVIGNSVVREHLSVVGTLVEAFKKERVPASRVYMTMLFAIPALKFEHSVDHPKYGEYNRALIDLVDTRWPGSIVQKDGKTFLDLEQVFIGQAREAGISAVSAMCSLGEYPHLAHTCADPEKRNLIIVRRDS